MTFAIPKDSAKKRPVVVSLPPKKSVDSEFSLKHPQQGSEPNPCSCNNRITSSSSICNSENSSNNSSDLTSMLFLSKKQLSQKEPEFHTLPVATSIPSEVSNCNSEVKLGQLSATISESESEKEKKISISPPGNLYDDPAVMHVIEHSKDYYDGHTRKLSKTHPPTSSILKSGVVRDHALQCGFHPVCASNYCPDRIWESLAKKIEQLIDVKIRSAFNPISVIGDGARLDSLELTAARLDRRIFELEHHQKYQEQDERQTQQQGQLQRHQSMPAKATTIGEDKNTETQLEMLDVDKAALHATVSNLKSMLQNQQQDHASNTIGSEERASSSGGSKSPARDDGIMVRQLEHECQGLHARLAEEQRRSKQLEQQHVEFHKRQIEDHIKMEKLRQQIQTLEAELKKRQQQEQHKQQQQLQLGRNHSNSNQQNQLSRREQKTTQSHPHPNPHHSHHRSSTTNYHSKLPTPGSSPLSSHPEQHNSNQEEESVREEDGYLIFNTNINGELIHCKVKIPTMVASVRSPSLIRRVTDTALMSPPMTRACSPRDLMATASKKKRGLNPNAPEWRNGAWI